MLLAKSAIIGNTVVCASGSSKRSGIVFLIELHSRRTFLSYACKSVHCMILQLYLSLSAHLKECSRMKLLLSNIIGLNRSCSTM